MKNKRLVCIPGPTPVARCIQDQMARETVAFGDPDFVRDYKQLIEDLKSIFDCDGEAFPLAGTGTLAMEMAIANNTKSGDNVLIVSHGYFGDRFIDLCERKGLHVDIIGCEWGTVVSPAEIEKKLSEKEYSAITVTHVDTATGVAAPIKEIGDVVKKFENTIFIVDGVCATAAEEEYMGNMGIDVLLTGSQKAFGVAPGLFLVMASKKSLERRASLGRIPEFYCDYEKWLPVMENPAKYFATPAINLIWAMKESVEMIKREGVQNRYDRHKKNARAMQAAVESLGLKVLAEKEHRAVTLSNIIYMDGVDDAQFRNILMEEGIIVAGGLAAYAGKMFRLGHMGNIDTHDMVSTVATIERALHRVGKHDDMGKAVGVLMSELMK
ncbi:pyridoxal-phosphate-dependent aminotransferase family protein [Peptoclostridium litorale]|uniref:Putative aminotransferase n=2 Tax=Peptoclostridium litorale TaxID=1557 RepID=A0A069RGY6_PEPLI|nr:alanine--glyoxylate aminotransferase family protein [Peptoclostridium litorale]KDR96299.1 putative aminotransferase [Peptoclostridium litorale DSM 5388]